MSYSFEEFKKICEGVLYENDLHEVKVKKEIFIKSAKQEKQAEFKL